MRRTGLLAITLILAASSAAHAINGDGGYQSQQGLWLHGTAAPLEVVDIPFAGATRGGQPFAALRIDAGQLHGTIDSRAVDGAGLVGTQLAPPGFVLTITDARPHHNIYRCASSGWEYRVEWRVQKPATPADAATRALCSADHAAVAVPGSWRTGQLEASDEAFTFACVPAGAPWKAVAPKPAAVPEHKPLPQVGPAVGSGSCALPALGDGGVIAKCIDYGYAPWAQGTPALQDASQLDGSRLPVTDDTARQLHNLCAVAMRADYAGNGTPHTLGGTLIRMYDASNVGVVSGVVMCGRLGCPKPGVASPVPVAATKPVAVTKPPAGTQVHLPIAQIDGLVVEGIWTLTDAKPGAAPRAHALCLGKKRWTAVDPSTPSMNGMIPSSDHVCDDRTWASLASIRPLLISYSAYIDVGLHRFSNGRDQITTTHVVIDANGTFSPEAKLCPKDGCRGYHDQFEGTILSPDLDDTSVHALDAYGTRRLVSYRVGAHTVTTAEDIADAITVPARPARVEMFEEGYVFVRPPELSPGDFRQVDRLGQPIAEQIEDRTLTLWEMNGAYTTSVVAPAGGHTASTPLGVLLRRVVMVGNFPAEVLGQLSSDVAARARPVQPIRTQPASTLAPSPQQLRPIAPAPPHKN